MNERRFRIGPVVLALLGEGRALDAFCASLMPFSTADAPHGSITFTFRVDAMGAQTVPLPRVEGTKVIGTRLRAEFSTARLRVTQAEGTGEVANAFRWLLAELLLERNALLIHGVGVLEKRAALFTGPSGAGKSTLGLAVTEGGLTVLGDELVVIKDGSKPHAYGTPWNTGARADAELKLMGTLGWTDAPALTSIPASKLLRVATDNVLLPRDEPSTRAKVAAVLLAVLGKVKTARLDFAPNPSVAEVLRAELAQ